MFGIDKSVLELEGANKALREKLVGGRRFDLDPVVGNAKIKIGVGV